MFSIQRFKSLTVIIIIFIVLEPLNRESYTSLFLQCAACSVDPLLPFPHGVCSRLTPIPAILSSGCRSKVTLFPSDRFCGVQQVDPLSLYSLLGVQEVNAPSLCSLLRGCSRLTPSSLIPLMGYWRLTSPTIRSLLGVYEIDPPPLCSLLGM